MLNLTTDLKQRIFSLIIRERYFQRLVENGRFMPLVDKTWPISNMPPISHSERFTDFGEELNEKIMVNDDLNFEQIFSEHLKLMNLSDKRFVVFVIDVLNGCDISGNLPVAILELSQLLGAGGCELKFESNDGGVYVFDFSLTSDFLNDVQPNSIPFYVTSACGNERSDRRSSHAAPPEFPAFVLVHNPGWNDYSCYSWFSLFYYPNEEDWTLIGNVKIIRRGEDDTFSVISKQFLSLPESFCSLGMDNSYYKFLYDRFGSNAWGVVKALRDAACFSQIEEDFANDFNFKHSLCRENSSERALREGRFILAGHDMRQCYTFKFLYKPDYDKSYDDPVEIPFNFKYNCRPFERIIGLIGENGVGKTCLLRAVTNSIAASDRNAFAGLIPFYSKIIVVSYSPFDNFAKPDEHATFRYSYCGLMKNEHELYTPQERIGHLTAHLALIAKRNLAEDFTNLLEIILEPAHIELIEKCLNRREGIERGNTRKEKKWEEFTGNALNSICGIMSSGQLNYLLTTAAVVANIRYDALLMFDEPEQHLHPNAITRLINGISSLLEKFKSYAIIATHSPLIVRELVSENVYILTRDDTMLSVAKIPIECFGEDIATLNDVIFGNRDQEKRFEEFIDRFVRNGKSYTDILKMIETDHIPLGLNAKLMIKRLLQRYENEKPHA